MTKDVTLSLRIDRKLSDKLEKRARQAKRSKSALATYAIDSFFRIEDEELARIRRTQAAIRAGEPTVPNEDVMRWVKSWGTPGELPMPKPRKKA